MVKVMSRVGLKRLAALSGIVAVVAVALIVLQWPTFAVLGVPSDGGTAGDPPGPALPCPCNPGCPHYNPCHPNCNPEPGCDPCAIEPCIPGCPEGCQCEEPCAVDPCCDGCPDPPIECADDPCLTDPCHPLCNPWCNPACEVYDGCNTCPCDVSCSEQYDPCHPRCDGACESWCGGICNPLCGDYAPCHADCGGVCNPECGSYNECASSCKPICNPNCPASYNPCHSSCGGRCNPLCPYYNPCLAPCGTCPGFGALCSCEFCLQRVVFGKGHPVLQDVSLSKYGGDAGPHWNRLGAGSSEKHPIAYTRNTPVHVKQILWRVNDHLLDGTDIDPETFDGSIYIEGTSVVGTFETWDGHFYQDDEGRWWVQAFDITADKPLPNTVKYYDALAIDWIIIVWPDPVGDPNKSTFCNEVSQNPLYVTQVNPPSSVTLHHTVIHLACKGAQNKTNPQSAINGIWAQFATKDVKRAQPTGDPPQNAPLRYYANWLTSNLTMQNLLERGDAQCYAWSHLLIHTFGVNGLGTTMANEHKITYASPWVFLIENWAPNAPPTGSDLDYPYFNVADTSGSGKYYTANAFRWVGVPELKDGTGVSGQNTANPLSMFGEHSVVTFNGKIYDPSYGSDYADLPTWWTEATAGNGYITGGVGSVEFNLAEN